MVIDTSALVAILQDEPERREFNEAIEAASSRRISVASFVESSLVIESRLGAEGLRDLDFFLEQAGINRVAVDAEQGRRGLCIALTPPTIEPSARARMIARAAALMRRVHLNALFSGRSASPP
ncbi:MAG: type II toxin-antitoxin system VapC family toxin [Acidobacteriota bacterium]